MLVFHISKWILLQGEKVKKGQSFILVIDPYFWIEITKYVFISILGSLNMSLLQEKILTNV